MEPEAVTSPNGASIDIDLEAPTPMQLAAPTEAGKNFLDSVPLDYRDKPWVAELAKHDNPQEEFFKKFENQQSLIGKKNEGLKVPAADAPDTEKQAFYKALGVPEKAEDYVYEAPKAPEGMEQFYQVDADLVKTLQEKALKGGMTPQAWKEMTDGYNEYYGKTVQTQIAQIDSQLKEVENTFKSHYGEKSPQVLATLDKATSAAPEWAKPILGALQPATKAALASVLQNFSEKYVNEDKLDISSVAGTQKGMSETEYGDEFEKRYTALRGAQNAHGKQSAEYLRAASKLAELRAQASSIFKGS